MKIVCGSCKFSTLRSKLSDVGARVNSISDNSKKKRTAVESKAKDKMVGMVVLLPDFSVDKSTTLGAGCLRTGSDIY